MKTAFTYRRSRNEARLQAEKILPDLLDFKKNGDQTTFNQKLVKILPEVKKYVQGKLITAEKKGHLSTEKYKADDIIDQLFIEVYDHIDEVKHIENFYLWLFKKTNELLEDVITQEAFDELYFENIDNYAQPEWDEMMENFSTDGDGDLILLEELDDISYNHNDYTLNHIFIEDNEKEFLENLDKKLSAETVNKHTHSVLHTLPFAMRDVFDLATLQKFTIEEIAYVRNTPTQEVERLLKESKKRLKTSFLKKV